MPLTGFTAACPVNGNPCKVPGIGRGNHCVARKANLNHLFVELALFERGPTMLRKEQWMQIHVLKTQGLSLREIARHLWGYPAMR